MNILNAYVLFLLGPLRAGSRLYPVNTAYSSQRQTNRMIAAIGVDTADMCMHKRFANISFLLTSENYVGYGISPSVAPLGDCQISVLSMPSAASRPPFSGFSHIIIIIHITIFLRNVFCSSFLTGSRRFTSQNTSISLFQCFFSLLWDVLGTSSRLHPLCSPQVFSSDKSSNSLSMTILRSKYRLTFSED